MGTSQNDPLLPSSALRRRLASVEGAAVAGILGAIGWGLSLRGLLATPGIGTSDAEITAYYADTANATTVVAWLQVMVFSTIAFLWFVGVVRGRIGDREPKLFGTVFLGASMLLASLLFLAASLVAAPAVQVTVAGVAPDPGAVSLLRAAASAVSSVFLPRVATLVMFSTATLGRVTGALPRWLVLLTYLIGLAELINVTLEVTTIYLVPMWVALVSVVLLIRRPAHAFELSPPDQER